MSSWTPDALRAQAGCRALVTGASGGLGYEIALALAGAGLEVILAARNEGKSRRAQQAILAAHPGAQVQLLSIDLASLASVRRASAGLLAEGRPLDLLINNAGVMSPPQRQLSADGFELQLATNYLGHYALTAQLLPLLRQARSPRTVQLSSIAHKQGKIDFDDLQSERQYNPGKAYGQSKLAMLMFALELQRRSDAAGWGLFSQAAHPGFARTDLMDNGPVAGGKRPLLWYVSRAMAPLLSHSAAEGALPVLMAASDAEAGGHYYGPTRMGELKGPPGRAKIAPQASDAAAAARLWETSAQLTGQRFDG